MDITIYRRHSADCPERDRYAPRCGCPLSFQFNWKQAPTTLDGKKLKRGQNKWTANTRSWSEAQTNAKKLEKDLEDLLQGKTVRHCVTVEAAIKEWLEFREKNRLVNTKPKLMGQKLIDWCEKNEIFLLTAITTDRVMLTDFQPVNTLGNLGVLAWLLNSRTKIRVSERDAVLVAA
jgi:hypothetical protein